MVAFLGVRPRDGVTVRQLIGYYALVRYVGRLRAGARRCGIP